MFPQQRRFEPSILVFQAAAKKQKRYALRSQDTSTMRLITAPARFDRQPTAATTTHSLTVPRLPSADKATYIRLFTPGTPLAATNGRAQVLTRLAVPTTAPPISPHRPRPVGSPSRCRPVGRTPMSRRQCNASVYRTWAASIPLQKAPGLALPMASRRSTRLSRPTVWR